MLFSVLAVNAQSSAEGFQLHAGLVFPTGKFASDTKSKSPDLGHGHAATGINIGGKYYSPLASVDKLSLVFGLDLFYNALQSDYTDDILEAAEDYDAEVTLPKYLNLSPTVGLNYQHPLTESFSLYGEVFLGLNYSKITNQTTTVDNDDYSAESTTSFKPLFGVAYGLEAGILVNNVSVSLRYNVLGSYKYKGEIEVDVDGDTDSEDIKFIKALPIEAVSLAVGLRF
jgi:hypothetical protein